MDEECPFRKSLKKGTDHTLESFRTLLDGTTNWPAVIDALEQTGYAGYGDVRNLIRFCITPRP